MAMIETLTDIPSVAQYLNRINAEPRTLRSAVVREVSGKYWRDVAVVKVLKNGEVKAPAGYEPDDNEAAMIKAECNAAVWPEHQLVHSITNPPADWTGADPETIFEFRDEKDRIIMVQQRILDKEGERKYVPWTFFTDGKWRRMEPEGKLPLWGIDQLKDYTTVFIHEGAKAARAMRRMIEAKTEDQAQKLKSHPWGEELSAAAHIGWIGGALSPARTDWSILKRLGIKRAYIVSDNDEAGVSAVPSISRELRVPTFHVQFTQDWPAAFDLADDFPKKMFKKMGGSTYYVGPSFRSCLHPATWATEQIIGKPGPKGGKAPVTLVLREEFKNLWAYVEEADVFVCKEMPEILRPEAIVNKLLAPFSHTKNTTELMIASYRGRNTKLCYRPDLAGRVVTDKTTSAINLHTPTHIKAKPGDPAPWLEFLEYMFPVEYERKDVMRWCATLIARPDIKMDFGMLLVSETQGVGKEQPLTSKIMTPDGWKTMGEMKVGTVISDINGGRQIVTGVYPQGEKAVYQVTFSDGSVVECGAEHNWMVRQGPSWPWQVLTTKQLIDVKSKMRVPVAQACKYEAGEPLPVPPYVLGALIGDGYLKRSACISIPAAKRPILEHMQELLADEFDINLPASGAMKSCPQYVITKKSSDVVSMPKRLESLGLRVKSPERFIPEQYLWASAEDRLELLRGLMDTDGTSSRGRTSLTTSSPSLATGVAQLVRSLGGTAKVASYPSAKGKHREFVVRIWINECPFRRESKTRGWRKPTKEWGNRIVSIKEIGSVEQQCISVSSHERLYITDNFKVTHNTTLGAKVLAPLVGDQNVGFPSEDDIVNSPFNGWVAHKRLIIIGEIYSGHSWKAYNKLKSYITDKDIDYNQKYMRPYRVENWAHVLASSNSRKALKMEETDRRWFYPQVIEAKWPRKKFGEFNEWLMSGGLQIIRHWAQNYGDYVLPGEAAPDTEHKKKMIRDSRSEAQQELADLCEAVVGDELAVVLAMKEISAWLRAKFGTRFYDTDHDLKKAAAATGFKVFDERIKVGSQLQYVLMSPKFHEQFWAKAKDLNGAFSGSTEARSMIRGAIKNPVELIQSDM